MILKRTFNNNNQRISLNCTDNLVTVTISQGTRSAAQSNIKAMTKNSGCAKATGHLIKPHLCNLVITVILQNVDHVHSPHTRILSYCCFHYQETFPYPKNSMTCDSSVYIDCVSMVIYEIDFIFKVKWRTDFAFGGQLCILIFIFDFLNKLNYIS